MIKYVTIAEKELSKYKNNILNKKNNSKKNNKLKSHIILPLIRKNLSVKNENGDYTKRYYAL